MISHQQRQDIIRNANDAQGHARMVLAKCIAGLAVLVLLAVAGAMGTTVERKDATRLQPSGPAEQSRREAFEAHRATYEAEQSRAKEQRSAAR